MFAKLREGGREEEEDEGGGVGGEHLVFQLNDTLRNYGDRIQARCPSDVARKQRPHRTTDELRRLLRPQTAHRCD